MVSHVFNSRPNPNIHAMIVAAGSGSRFDTRLPKQYLIIQSQTLLQHSVKRLFSSRYINNCTLVIANDDTIAQTLDFVMPIQFVVGGLERWQSVSAGVNAIIKAGADLTDLVLIHDAARPTVPVDDIKQVITAAINEPYGAILATPVVDTLKRSEHQLNSTSNQLYDYAKSTINRDSIWQSQTPQVYRLGQLQQVLSYVAEHKLNITDEASAFEMLDLPIRLVTGSRQNIKLTYPEDDILLSAILTAQQ